MVKNLNTGDLETPVSNLVCAIRVGAPFIETVLNAAASGHPFSREDANSSVWALYQITTAAESLDNHFRAVLADHCADRRQA